MNNKISVAQLQALIIIGVLGFEILIMPMIVKSILQLCIILTVSLLLCILAICSNINIEKNKVLCYMYTVKNIIVIVLLTKILADVIKNVMLTGMSIYKIVFIITVISAYSAFKGVEVIGRIAQLLFWFIVVGTIYVYAMAVPDIDLSNIDMGISINNLIIGIVLGFIINIAEMIILLKPYLRNNSKEIIKGILIGLIMLFAITFIVIGKLSMTGIDKVEYPLFEIMYTADLPNVFIKRQEGIFISLWIISSLISIFIYFTTTVDLMKGINFKNKSSIIFIMIFVFIAASVYNGNMRAIRTYCFLQIIGGIFTVLIIPLIYILRGNKIE